MLFLFLRGYATNYYVSSTDGNDSYSAAQAQNSSTPWQSVSKANSFFSSLRPGDYILFKRGDIFYGSLSANASGNSSNRITIGAYGSGAKPVFSGLSYLSNWSNNGNGVWQCSVPTSSNSINLVTINGVAQAMGRFPNADASNGGYLTYENFGNGYINDNQLSGSPNWTGADAVIRKKHWIIDICKISNHSGTTLNYTYPSTGNSYPGMTNFGYFIQNDPRTLDKFGEWYFNPQTKVLQMYFGGNIPSAYSVNVSTINNVVNLDPSQNGYITLDNIAVEGANQYGIYSIDGNSITIQNCDVNNTGNSGIFIRNVPNTAVENCQVTNSLNCGIDINNSIVSPTTVRYNSVRNSGLFAGMGISGDKTYTGVIILGNNIVAEYNTVDGVGYNALEFQGSNVNIKNNYVNNFCSVKDDGGGIYTWAGNSPNDFTNRVITGNIVTNAIGAKNGTDGSGSATYIDARGIYIDGGSMNINATNNSIANCIGSAIYANDIVNVNISGNTTFNTQYGLRMDRFNGGSLLRNNTIANNIFFPLYKTQTSLFYWNETLYVPVVTDIQSDMRAIGSFSNNYYRNDLDAPFDYFYHTNVGGTFVDPPPLNFNQWKTFMNQDFNSNTTPVIPAYTINSISSTNTVQNPQFTTGISGLTFWSPNNNHTASWDNSGKISGGAVNVSANSSTLEYTSMYAALGSVTAGKSYILRFTTLGTTPYGYLKASLRQSNSPYSTFTNTQARLFGASQQTHEFLITPSVSEANASYLIDILQSSGTVYIDNIEFYEASVTNVDAASQARFEYNPSQNDKTISLDANYIGVDNTKYSGSVTIPAYSSKIFIRDNNSPVTTAPAPPPATTGSTLAATSAAPAISCFGGSTSVSVNASRGTTPYSGVGTFTATAGKGSLKLSVSNPVSGKYTLTYASIGAVSSDKTFILHFSTLGTTGSGVVRASLRQTSSPFASITPVQTKSFGTSKVEHEFIFNNPGNTGDASFLIEVDQNSGTTYIDNIAFFEGTSSGSLISANKFSTGNFENGISQVSTWSESNNHLAEWDTNSKINATNYYSVTDAAGVVRTSGIAISQPAAALQAFTSAPAITVIGGGSVVTVTATGGTAPYTGTGNFNVGAGTYNYTVKDANGCSSVASIILTDPLGGNTGGIIGGGGSTGSNSDGSGAQSVTVTQNAVSCFGSTTTVNVSASGGTAPYTGTGSFTTSSGKGSLKLYSNSPVSYRKIYNYASIGAVKSDRYYVLRFSTVGTTNDNSLSVSLRQSSSPYASITEAQTHTYGIAKTDHEFLFSNPAATGDASFLIQIPQLYGATYIDNIAFFEASSSGTLISANLFPAGNFEDGISQIFSWSQDNNHAAEWDTNSIINGTDYYSVTDANGVVRTGGITISQPSAALQAFSSATPVPGVGGGTVVTVTATGGAAPYSGTGTFNVGVGNYGYTVTDANGCTAYTSIVVGLAGARIATSTTSTTLSGSSRSVDSASLLTTSAASLTVSSYPNPSTAVFNVAVRGGTQERVYLNVMSFDGKLLYKTVGTTNQTYTFGSNFIPGIYTVQIRQGSTVQSVKLIKGR